MTMLERIRKIFTDKPDREAFFGVVGRYFPTGSTDYLLVENAYNTAKDAFRDVQRENGERYFEHLRCVALILMVYLRVRDANVIAAALLHDIVEDITNWSQERIATLFNQVIGELVWWVSKPSISNFGGDKEARNRAYHQTLARAPRDALLIKLADRLHNLITLWAMSIDDQRRKISETQDFYLPIAEKETVLIHEIEAAIAEVRASW
jgi:(p)ppGpp synthase/HD superfamily hydrolase